MTYSKAFLTARDIHGYTCIPVGRINTIQIDNLIQSIEKYRCTQKRYTNNPCWIDLEYSDTQYEISNDGFITKASRYVSNNFAREFFDIKTTCQHCNLKKPEDCLYKILDGKCENTLANKLLWPVIFPNKYTK